MVFHRGRRKCLGDIKFKFIQLHMFIADIKVHIQYKIKIFKPKSYNDFTFKLFTDNTKSMKQLP